MADLGKITLPGVLHLPPFVVAMVVGAVFIGAIRLLPTQVKGMRGS
jgi:hypothetical protein